MNKNIRIVVTFISIIFLTATVLTAQVKTNNKQTQTEYALNRIDSLIQITNNWLEHIELDCSLKQRYKLYQTENIYTLLQLDTKTGMIEQVQWSKDSKNEFSLTINGDNLNYGFGMGQEVLNYIQLKTCSRLF